MSGKLRFQIPSIEEMEDDMSSGADKVKMQPLFKTHRHVKIDDDSTNVNKSISSNQTAHPSVSAKPSSSSSSNSSIQNRQGWQNRVNISSTNQQSSSGNFGTSKAPVKESVTQNRSIEPAPNGCVPKPVTSHSLNSSKTATVTSENNSTATNTQGQDASLPLPSLKPGKTNSIIVSARQRGNPVLKHVRNVPWEFGDVVPDYVLGQTTCALFLSLRYHHLNPNYIHERLKQLGHSFDGRILLVQVDVQDPHHSLKELAKICILADCTLILAWSPEEAGRYLETYKAFESKPPDLIMERTENEYLGRLTDCLTTVKKVNKPDAVTLMSTFGSLEKIIQADRDDLSLCPGFGPQKAQRLYDVFHEPFLKSKKKKLEDSPVKDAAKEQSPVKR